MLSILSVLLIVALSVLVTRIATIALVHTGLSRQAARFQARSAFTGVGFTTDEAELVVNHPVRRSIILLLMLLGNAGVVTAIVSLLLSFIDPRPTVSSMTKVLILVAGIGALWLASRSRLLDRLLSRVVTSTMERHEGLTVVDYARLLDVGRDYGVSECRIRTGDWLADRRLKDLSLGAEGILVLGIRRANGVYLGAPTGNAEVHEGDTLVLYGQAKKLQEISVRRQTPEGIAAHGRSVEEQKNTATEERLIERRNP